MKASTILVIIGALIAVFGLPIPGLSVVGVLLIIAGLVVRFLQ